MIGVNPPTLKEMAQNPRFESPETPLATHQAQGLLALPSTDIMASSPLTETINYRVPMTWLLLHPQESLYCPPGKTCSLLAPGRR